MAEVNERFDFLITPMMSFDLLVVMYLLRLRIDRLRTIRTLSRCEMFVFHLGRVCEINA